MVVDVEKGRIWSRKLPVRKPCLFVCLFALDMFLICTHVCGMFMYIKVSFLGPCMFETCWFSNLLFSAFAMSSSLCTLIQKCLILILKVKSNSLSSLNWNNEKRTFLWINKSFSCCNPISRLDEVSPLRSVHFFRRFKSCYGFCFVVKSWYISLDINTSFWFWFKSLHHVFVSSSR